MKKIHKIWVEKIPDYESDLSYLGTFSNEAGKFAVKHEGGRNSFPFFNAENVENMKQAKENYKRIMQYDNGELMDYGVKAFAEIHTADSRMAWTINKLSSGGLWGLSSDGDKSDFDSEGENQLAELREVLLALGFSDEDINSVKVEYKDWN